MNEIIYKDIAAARIALDSFNSERIAIEEKYGISFVEGDESAGSWYTVKYYTCDGKIQTLYD